MQLDIYIWVNIISYSLYIALEIHDQISDDVINLYHFKVQIYQFYFFFLIGYFDYLLV